MRILKVEPGKAPCAKEMEDGLKAIQREVEGLFQPLSMGDGVILCCNDEGKLNGMQPNRRLGEKAAELLLRRLSTGHEMAQCVLYPVELRLRESTKNLVNSGDL